MSHKSVIASSPSLAHSRRVTTRKATLLALSLATLAWGAVGFTDDGAGLDRQVRETLRANGFTGNVQSSFLTRLGRPIDKKLADIGRFLWFDTLTGLNDDNSCGGCHSPTSGFADTQSIAIGVDNNNLVGPNRAGPRNQRRTPSVVNTALYPNLMWNSRFSANSGDPFDNSAGFTFPPPEGATLSSQSHLMRAQAFIPPTERSEAAGFSFVGNNDDIRAAVVARLNATPSYRSLFGKVYPSVRDGGPITYDMFAAATAEFEFTLVFADAPVDKYARGGNGAMTVEMKRGALTFFGKGKCVSCHSVKGSSNEMFSDFKVHVAGTPQIVPLSANVTFDGPGGNEDFGLEQVTGDPADRYKFRSSPLRNLALQPTFFHNGSFTDLGAAIRYHLNPSHKLASYSTGSLDSDLRGPLAPMADVMARLDPALKSPPALTEMEIRDLITFVKFGLLDNKASNQAFSKLIPSQLPSGRPPMIFEPAGP